MIWYSSFYNKKYKWLSSQYIYILYFFNKLIVYLDLFFFNLFWVEFETTSLSYGYKKYTIINLNETRFFKPITAYLVNINSFNIVLNLYYKTNLQKFKVSTEDKVNESFFIKAKNLIITNKLFFIKKVI